MADPIGSMKAVGAVAPAVARPALGPTGEVAKAFGEFLKDAVQSMETQKASANALQQEFAAGGPVDVSQVTIAMEQASLSMQLLIEVRNKVLEAYETLLRMPV